MKKNIYSLSLLLSLLVSLIFSNGLYSQGDRTNFCSDLHWSVTTVPGSQCCYQVTYHWNWSLSGSGSSGQEPKGIDVSATVPGSITSLSGLTVTGASWSNTYSEIGRAHV